METIVAIDDDAMPKVTNLVSRFTIITFGRFQW